MDINKNTIINYNMICIYKTVNKFLIFTFKILTTIKNFIKKGKIKNKIILLRGLHLRALTRRYPQKNHLETYLIPSFFITLY